MTEQKKKRKLSTRMKKTIRRTLGGLLLVSAIVIALVPQKKMEADTGTPSVTVDPDESSIPLITSEDKIYTTGDGVFQFAYVEKGSGGDKVAVILGYDYERSLSGGTLQIPDTMDAYVKYTHAQGTSGGYVAVGKNGNILYYPIYKEVQEKVGEDEDGNPIYEIKQEIDRFDPCLYSTYTSWYYDENGNVRDPKAYYYEDASADLGYSPTNLEIHQRIQNASVAYISSQHVIKNDEGDWVLDDTEQVGIFSKATNITNLVTGSNLLGIGDYAFYKCASLQGIELADGANTIGNYAFANCVNLTEAKFPANSSILALGDHAFYNCNKLESFSIPVAVEKIGDSAFEGCTKLKVFDMNPGGKSVLLKLVGKDVFKNCKSLEYLAFPETFSSEFDISWIRGCTSLKYIRIPNISMQMVAKADFAFSDLMEQLPKEFYFEGEDESLIHTISTQNNFAFKYLDEEIYEKVVVATDTAGSGKSVYRINDKNELIYFYMDDTVVEVELPDTIGPYQITKIGSTSFHGNHNIKKISIPSSIVEIQDDAFSGCHNLKHVVFDSPINITSIGEGAFDTQQMEGVVDECTLENQPTLSFTGEAIVGSVPYDYAMNPDNNINVGGQQTTYITFYTGWPSNLTIQYNPVTGKKELTDYPSNLEELSTKYTKEKYPYIDQAHEDAAASAYAHYQNGENMSQDEKAIISSVLNVKIPTGVESVEEGLFSGIDSSGKVISTPNTTIETITFDGGQEVAPYMFAGCSNLIGAYINSNTVSLGDYAFKDCVKLTDVDISDKLNSFGALPFAGCTELTEVNFGTNPKFTCVDAIIYGTENGKKTKLLEILESRGVKYGSGAVTAAELADVKELAPMAAKNCTGILSLDLSQSAITEIPESCFENTTNFYSIVIPDTCKRIGKNAFKNSNIRYLEIPTSVTVIDNTAFEGDKQLITFYCELDSAAAIYAESYDNIVVSEKAVTYKVTFCDEDGTVLDVVTVAAGTDASTTVVPTKEGYVFDKWLPAPVCVTSDMSTYATYTPYTKTYTVRFIDYDDKVLSEQQVEEGGTPITPVSPTRTGYKFVGWRPSYEKITKDTDVYAQYEKESSSDSGDKDDNGNGNNNGGNNSGNNNGNNSGNDAKLYTLTVINGSGGGSYVAGATVILLADNPPAGKVFDKWTTETEGISFLSSSVAATTITMPACNATVTANYKTSASGSTGNNNNNNNNNNNSGNNNNTVVDVDKNGFTDDDLASAVVSGSTDNFVLKITESAYAKAQIEEALKTEYGSLDDLKYFCMDISLYDSTGTKKVENTDDLKVTITLPIPNDLVKYAGNNKVAYVVNGKLIQLKPKFTTINGVACMTFVAPHFSPYTIYVDTTNLSASTIIDSTPKTGDLISPKWFLCIGMVGLSVFLFTKKDKKKVAAK